jgi:hypothetical protein
MEPTGHSEVNLEIHSEGIDLLDFLRSNGLSRLRLGPTSKGGTFRLEASVARAVGALLRERRQRRLRQERARAIPASYRRFFDR